MFLNISVCEEFCTVSDKRVSEMTDGFITSWLAGALLLCLNGGPPRAEHSFLTVSIPSLQASWTNSSRNGSKLYMAEADSFRCVCYSGP